MPALVEGQKIVLEVKKICQAGEFYLNGLRIDLPENGVMAFGFDVTNLVNVGDTENAIVARIDNDWNNKEKATNTKFQ